MNFPTNPMYNAGNPNQMQLVTGTTGLALKYADGMILVADRRASAGTFVASKRAKKVHKLNEYTGMGIAGLVSDAQTLIDVMKSELRLYELENSFQPSIRVAASLLSTIIHGGFRRYTPWWVQLLVGGVDRRGSHVYVLDPSGSLSEEDYIAIGSGTLLAMGVLEASWKPELTKVKAKELGINALKMAIGRDIATGNGIDGLIFSTKEEVAEEIHIDL
ncbi:MAG: proteasome subunit beta [Candidatus Heimdallarchaeota archaeon]|nr:MAG: proteasome subunit beta [Candidatus Heimdallarchaeota archaeon]